MKRLHLKGSWIIKASREDIYKIVSDFENIPKHFSTMSFGLKSL